MQSISADLANAIHRAVAFALDEDIGAGDITAELIAPEQRAEASIITREACVLCGVAWVEEVFAQLGGEVSLHWQAADGDEVAAGAELLRLAGPARTLLTGERTALNFLQTLSATATAAREFARGLEGSSLVALDTRKTLPCLRQAQKYAVRVGGCHNHRMGLYDAFLIKENHIAACGSIALAVARARSLHPDKPVIVEVETLAEYDQAAAAGADRIMLDDFSAEALAEVQARGGSVPLEVSGSVDAARARDLTRAGIQAVSSGALTKHVRAIDLSMRLGLTR